MSRQLADQSALKHHLDRAIDHASILISLAQHRLTPQDPLNQLRSRQMLQLEDRLQLFSFHARKSIELAGAITKARELRVVQRSPFPPPTPSAKEQPTGDLWWALNRVVHSRLLSVEEAEDEVTMAEWPTTMDPDSHWTPSIFVVSSDHDVLGQHHWVEVHRLVMAFLELRGVFDRALGEAAW